MKKMKKRRELDALVNGKLGRRKKGQHELLRNDSESSEVEEFSIPEKSVIRTNNTCRFCATCMTVCGFFLLAACVAAIAGLVWVHIEMKKEVDQLRSQLGQIQSTPQSRINQIVTKQESLEKSIKELGNVVPKMHANVTNLIKQMEVLHTNVTKLSKNKEEPIKQPVELQDVVQNVANMGSRLKTLEDEHKNLAHLPDQKINELTEDMDLLNRTMMTHYQQTMAALTNVTRSVDLRLSLVEAKPGSPPGSPPVPNINHLVHNALDEVMSNLSESQGRVNAEAVEVLQEQMTLINSSLIQVQQQVQKVIPNGSNVTDVSEVMHRLGVLKNHTVIALMNVKKNFTSLDDRLSTVEDTLHSRLTDIQTPPKANTTANKSLVISEELPTKRPPITLPVEPAKLTPPTALGNTNSSEGQESTMFAAGGVPTTPAKTDTKTNTSSSEGEPKTPVGDVHSMNATGREAVTVLPPQTDKGENTSVPRSAFHIEEIQTVTDLEDRFPTWDSNSDGSLNYVELLLALGPKTPDADKFQALVALFDTDQDHQLSEQEFAQALGFNLDDTSMGTSS